jgi:hypothetical protein
MADDGGGWDDLFAMAAGDESPASAEAAAGTKRPNQSSAEAATKKKKKKAKKDKTLKNKERHRGGDAADHHKRMLESRMNVSKEATRQWPAWIRPGGSLLEGFSSSPCREYIGPYDASGDGKYDPTKKRKCSACGKSPLHHALVTNSARSGMPADDVDHLNIFLWNRNIRASAFIALTNNNTSGPTTAAYAKVAIQHTSQINSRIHSITSRLPSAGEASILEEKSSALHRAAKAWRNRRDGAPSDFDTIVRVIIASDAFYYRLYYLQLTASIPIREAETHIPHPTSYFVADLLCWDTVAGSRYVRKLLKRDDCGGKIPEIVKNYSAASAPSASSDHPLTLLKSSRFAETLLLFGDWSKDPQTKRDFARAVKAATFNPQSLSNLSEDAFYDMHECPAPRLLMGWRDVCRDYSCNLYAYATLGPDSIADVKSLCASAGIIEVGAGTGYYAQVFQTVGINVKPSDIASTDASFNEYHGSTPSFTRVENGGVDMLKSSLRQFHKKSLPALLLCYPPPLSEMAENALKTFVGAGGKQVVYIGEFKGLTGSPRFERILLDHFRCIHRAPCLSWGTDAPTISVWESSASAKTSTNAAQILIPCSNCKSKPSTHRFRLVRSLNYCCKVCYEEHALTRSAHALCNMIPIELIAENASSFDDEAYMMSLQGTEQNI